MRILNNPTKDAFLVASKRPAMVSNEARVAAEAILAQVKREGMRGVMELTKKFDRSSRADIRVPARELSARAALIDPELACAIRSARENIEKFHRAQYETPLKIETTPGVVCWRRPIPIASVGLYIPGGTAPLFSTALMLGIPAVLAGCSRIALCTPPDSDGSVPASLAYICVELGITEVYCIGGAQAIGFLAYGADGVAPVSKIFGPGNQYVTCAKELVAREGVGIDMPAGPSEVLVIADKNANVAGCAADLLAQAEHGADSQVILITDNENYLSSVLGEIEIQLATLPRSAIARKALSASVGVVVHSLQAAVELSNLYAPEHLILSVAEPEEILDLVQDAGSVFVGYDTPESLGDYASGTNHTLPTSGFAKILGGVSLESFVRKVTFQRATRAGLNALGATVVTMARAEGLEGHARAVTVRLGDGERK